MSNTIEPKSLTASHNSPNMRSFMLTELKALPRLAPLKKTELPKLYFGEGANPFDLLLKPCGTLRDRNPSICAVKNKTIIEYLYDLPAHMDAFREVLAYNLILHPDEAQRFTVSPEEIKPGRKLSPEGEQSILAQLHTQPLRFLRHVHAVNKNDQMNGKLKLDVRDHFHFDFDQYKTRLAEFRHGLRERNLAKIREGVMLLREMKKLYDDVPKRLYAMDSGDPIAISSVDHLYAPFRQVLGAIAFKLQHELKATSQKSTGANAR